MSGQLKGITKQAKSESEIDKKRKKDYEDKIKNKQKEDNPD